MHCRKNHYKKEVALNEIYKKYKDIIANNIQNAAYSHVEMHTQQPTHLNREMTTFMSFIGNENITAARSSCLHHPYILNTWGLLGGLFIVVGLTGWVTSAFYFGITRFQVGY